MRRQGATPAREKETFVVRSVALDAEKDPDAHGWPPVVAFLLCFASRAQCEMTMDLE